ncbi:hypothetical protein [Pantoea agglomerans]|uniref:hypothetical protein n=1 Tax=Enterobacter agglomerans TaxID=549 RepID=UPI0034CDDFCF
MNFLENKITLSDFNLLKSLGLRDKKKIQLVYNHKLKIYFGRVDNDYKAELDSFIKAKKIKLNKDEVTFLLYEGLNKGKFIKRISKLHGFPEYYIKADDIRSFFFSKTDTNPIFIGFKNILLKRADPE